MEIGVDIVDLRRFDLENTHFIQRVLTIKEYEFYSSLQNLKRQREYLGGRFAGKEAYMKACHQGLGSLSFQDIEILNDKDGAPYLNDEYAKISISHEDDYAIAFVMKEK